MLIQCTKKLCDQLGVKPEPAEDGEPLFSWHANLITINRKKTVVLMNDQTYYVVVLHGLKAKDFKKFEAIVAEAIRETFKEEGIKDEIIEKYLAHAPAVTYAKTKNRSFVSRLNRACDSVYFTERFYAGDANFNSRISKSVSGLLVGDGKNDFFSPNEAMYKALEAFAGEPIFRVQAVQVKVTLLLENHRVWRRLVVPLNRTFDEFHKILQIAFGWDDYHLHEFYIYEGAKSENPVVNLVCDQEAFAYPGETEMRLEQGIRLAEYLPAHRKLEYNYDFGDDWQHEIEIEQVIDDFDKNYPVCLEGEGSTPPEDVGGEGGFDFFLEAIADSNHPDHKHMKNWSASRYREFEVEKVNKWLRSI